MTDPHVKLHLLDKIDREYLSEHFHRVRTANGRLGDRPKFTAVVRADGDGGLKEPAVIKHRPGSHLRPDGDNVVLKLCLGGRPFMSADRYDAVLRNAKQKRRRRLKAKADRRYDTPRA